MMWLAAMSCLVEIVEICAGFSVTPAHDSCKNWVKPAVPACGSAGTKVRDGFAGIFRLLPRATGSASARRNSCLARSATKNTGEASGT